MGRHSKETDGRLTLAEFEEQIRSASRGKRAKAGVDPIEEKLLESIKCLLHMVEGMPLSGVELSSDIRRMPGVGGVGFVPDYVAQISFPREYSAVGKDISHHINKRLDRSGYGGRPTSRHSAVMKGNVLQINLEDLYVALNSDPRLANDLADFAAGAAKHHENGGAQKAREEPRYDPEAPTVILSRSEIERALAQPAPAWPATPLQPRASNAMYGQLTTSAAISDSSPADLGLSGHKPRER